MTPDADYTLSDAEVRQVQLSLLHRFARYCDEHDLDWFLFAGSLLGAVRHQGYIPWDDDIDVVMPRAAYDEFCRLYPSSGDPNARLIDMDTDGRYQLPFAKFYDVHSEVHEDYNQKSQYGVNIDIFPLDGWPSNPYVSLAVRSATIGLRRVLSLQLLRPRSGRSSAKSSLLRISRPLVRRLGDQTCSRMISWLMKSHDPVSTGFCGVGVWAYAERVPWRFYAASVQVEFEGQEYPAPAQYHEVLTAMYGDYLSPPPRAQQVTHHSYVAYRK